MGIGSLLILTSFSDFFLVFLNSHHHVPGRHLALEEYLVRYCSETICDLNSKKKKQIFKERTLSKTRISKRVKLVSDMFHKSYLV